MTSLVDQVVAVTGALAAADVPYALGGALALAYATEEPRGTRDIDVNVFVDVVEAERVFDALPREIGITPADRERVERDEQVRLWWDATPVDVFFAASAFHLAAGTRARTVDFAGRPVRVLAPDDLAVFKVLFDRPKDWVDVETMAECGTLDPSTVVDAVAALLGDDPRVGRLVDLFGRSAGDVS